MSEDWRDMRSEGALLPQAEGRTSPEVQQEKEETQAQRTTRSRGSLIPRGVQNTPRIFFMPQSRSVLQYRRESLVSHRDYLVFQKE